MKEGKHYLFVCVLLWALAIERTVRAAGSHGEEAEEEEEDRPAGLSAEGELADDAEPGQIQPLEALRLYDAEAPSVTSLVVNYLTKDGTKCTRKRLAVSVVGADSEKTKVGSLLEKLSHVFGVQTKYHNARLLVSSSGAWLSLLELESFQAPLSEDLDPFENDADVKDLCGCNLFVGRAPPEGAGSYTCEDVSLDGTSLAALPAATEAALPAVIMEADRDETDEEEEKGLTGSAVSVEKLLKEMVPATDRLYPTRRPPAETAGDLEEDTEEHEPSDLEIETGNEWEQLNNESVYIHTQHQLDLLFPAGTYQPVSVISPSSRLIAVASRAVHAYPACKSSYACTAWRHLRLLESSWNALREPPESTSPPLPDDPSYSPVAKLLAARAGTRAEQHPQVVLMRLFKNEETGEERWLEQPLNWVETPSTGEEPSPPTQTFRQVLAVNARYAASLTRLLRETSLRRLLVKKMVQLYNINKEELFSMWDKEPSHSAVDPNTMEGVLTRPLNVPIFRPIHPRDVLVSPADSVIQHLYQVAPDPQKEIHDLYIPQIKDDKFYLSDFLYGNDEGAPVPLQDETNRLNVIVHHLSPHDYQRVHSPADWKIENVYHVPACYPPGTNRRPPPGSTLSTVERTSLVGTWDPEGTGEELFFALVLVGGDSTGGTRLAWEEAPTRSRRSLKPCADTEASHVPGTIPMCVGQELGQVTPGSHVILIFETHEGFQMNVNTCDGVLVGQREGILESGERKIHPRCNPYPSAYATPIAYLRYLRSKPNEAGKALIKNKQLPSSWRASAKTAVNEIARSIEKGLLHAHGLAQQMMSLYPEHPRLWEKIIIGQPVALLKRGGADATDRRSAIICYPDHDRKRIRVKFQGQQSTLVLVFTANRDDGILFDEPHFGCDGHSHLGNRATGLQASWAVEPDGSLDVEVTAKCGLGGQHSCVTRSATVLLDGAVQAKAACKLDWESMGKGTTVTECEVKSVDRQPRFTPFEVHTPELICPETQRLPRDAPEDAGEETPEDAREEPPEDAREEPPEDAREETPEDAREETPEDAREETPEDAREEAPEDAREETPEDGREEAPEEEGEETPEDMREDTREETPDDLREDALEE